MITTMTFRDNDSDGLAASLNGMIPFTQKEQGLSARPDTVWRIELRRRASLVKLCKFLAVGGSGILVNTLALLILFQWTHLPLIVAAVIAAELAIINNFCWNDRWTFSRARISLRRFCRFNLVSLGGLIINTLTLWFLVSRAALPYLAVNLVGIVLATTWNFAANMVWTWGGVA